jgi:Bacteriophage minor capsid protein
MKLESINNFLNDSTIHTFYPLMFPSSSEVCSVFDITGGTVERGGVRTAYLRVLTRETHPKLSVDKAEEIKEYLFENMKGAFFDGKKVLNIETDNPSPLFIGEEDGNYLVSMNYTILIG